MSENIRNGTFDASDELYVFLQQATAFKLKETDSSKISEELECPLAQLI